MHFIGSNRKQAAIVYYQFVLTVAYLNTAYNSSKHFFAHFAHLNTYFFSVYLNIRGLLKGLGKFVMGFWKVSERSWIFCQ